MAIYENGALKELPIYGSSRLGVYRVQGGSLENDRNKLTLGRREYELGNHLGNVLATVSDVKLPAARVLSFTDYYAFGGAMPGRSGGSYRYGFNGHERDDEVAKGNHTAEFWEYNGPTGRRWNVDPVAKPHESPYAAFANSPVWIIDPNGADSVYYNSVGKVFWQIKAKGPNRFFRDNGKGGMEEFSVSSDRTWWENRPGDVRTVDGIDGGFLFQDGDWQPVGLLAEVTVRPGRGEGMAEDLALGYRAGLRGFGNLWNNHVGGMGLYAGNTVMTPFGIGVNVTFSVVSDGSDTHFCLTANEVWGPLSAAGPSAGVMMMFNKNTEQPFQVSQNYLGWGDGIGLGAKYLGVGYFRGNSHENLRDGNYLDFSQSNFHGIQLGVGGKAASASYSQGYTWSLLNYRNLFNR
jgi:RHS repeat-associated protein